MSKPKSKTKGGGGSLKSAAAGASTKQTRAVSMVHLLSPDAPQPNDLMVRELLPEQPGFIVAIDGLLSKTECNRLVRAAMVSGLQPPRPDDLRPKKGEAFLNREMLTVVDEQFAATLWSRLRPHIPELDGRDAVGLHGDVDGSAAMLKFYRYRKGHSFGLHVDTTHKGAAGEETEYTLLIYLNTQGEQLPDDVDSSHDVIGQTLVGGDTVFMKNVKSELCRVSPRAGMALLHAHGRRCCMHEAEQVTRGAKWVLRADVLYRRHPRAREAGALDTAASLHKQKKKSVKG